MRLSKSALYALYAALEMAASDEKVTVGGVSERYDIPQGALARVFQRLVHAGIARGVRGVGGGYELARTAASVTVLDVLEVFDAGQADAHFLLGQRSEKAQAQPGDARISRLFDEVAELVRSTYASVTLETLRGRGAAAPSDD